MPQDFRHTFEFSVWPGERIEWFLRVIVNIEQNCPRQQAENLFTSNWAYIPCLIFLLGQCQWKVKVILVACLSFSAAGISPYSEGIRFVKLFRHRLELKTTLWPDKILSGITDSNGPCPETANTYQFIWPTTKINKTEYSNAGCNLFEAWHMLYECVDFEYICQPFP